jgi:hypothetical protein
MVSSQTLSDFEDLKEDMTVLSLHLNVLRALYAQGQEDVDLLNAIASGTFWVIQNALQDSIVLRVARLTDPPKMNKRENLTLRALIEGVENDGDTTLAQQLRDKYANVEAQTGPIIDLRHKVTAHTDRPTRRGAVPVPTVRIEEVSQAAGSIEEFLNIFDRAVNGGTTVYSLSITDGEGAVLLRRLREAVAYREEVPDWYLLGNSERDRIQELRRTVACENEGPTSAER